MIILDVIVLVYIIKKILEFAIRYLNVIYISK